MGPARRQANDPQTARVAADYLAGMTDRFALEEHRRLFGSDVSGMTNLFSDFRRLVVLPALEELVADGRCRQGSISSRVAVEPPRDPGAWRSRDQRRDGAGAVPSKSLRWRSPRGS